jgi:hypothetical protein
MPVVVNYPPPSSVVVNEVTGAVTVVQSGKPGPQGIQGVQGIQGIPGDAATVAAGTTTTGAAGSSASVTNSGSSSAAVFDFTIPQGIQGVQGIQGIQGEPGVVTATSPATYDAPTQTVGVDQTAIAIQPSQVAGTAVTLGNELAQRGQSLTVIDTVSRYDATNATPVTTGVVYWSFFTPLLNLNVSELTMVNGGTAGASLTLVRMGLYEFDGTNLTLLAQTANDATLFTGTFTIYTRSFDTAGGYPANVTLTQGTRYATAFIVVGTTMPNPYSAPLNLAGTLALAPRLNAQLASQADLPAGPVSGFANSNRIHFSRLS